MALFRGLCRAGALQFDKCAKDLRLAVGRKCAHTRRQRPCNPLSCLSAIAQKERT